VPKLFAAFAMMICFTASPIHWAGWGGISRWPEETAGYRAFLPTSVWSFMDGLVDTVAQAHLCGALASSLLVVVGWGLWYRRWWARRAVLGWCALVASVLCVDYLLVLDMVDQTHVFALDTLQAANHSLTSRLAQVLNQAESMGLLASLVLQPLAMVQQSAVDVAVSEMEAGARTLWFYYASLVAWFPLLLVLAFGPRSACKFFDPRPEK
jgi:hypothetical protein